MVIWITGLPGAGKTTIARLLLAKLRALGKQSLLIDGDAIRDVLQVHTYDSESRKSVALTYAHLAKMFSLQDSIAICATVSMFDDVRAWNRTHISNYFEIYVQVPNDVLRNRNQKNLYSDAENGNAKHVHGFDLAVELPKHPDLTLLNDGSSTPAELVNLILEKIIR